MNELTADIYVDKEITHIKILSPDIKSYPLMTKLLVRELSTLFF